MLNKYWCCALCGRISEWSDGCQNVIGKILIQKSGEQKLQLSISPSVWMECMLVCYLFCGLTQFCLLQWNFVLQINIKCGCAWQDTVTCLLNCPNNVLQNKTVSNWTSCFCFKFVVFILSLPDVDSGTFVTWVCKTTKYWNVHSFLWHSVYFHVAGTRAILRYVTTLGMHPIRAYGFTFCHVHNYVVLSEQ